MTTASARASQPRPHDVLERGDERRRRVERLGAPQRRAGLARGARRLHVDVEQDLGVVAHEADRARRGSAARRPRRARAMSSLRSGPIHGSGVRPALWYAMSIPAMPARVGDAARGRRDFVGVARRRASMTRTGRLCAVKTTVFVRPRGAAARTRSANASSSSGCAWNERDRLELHAGRQRGGRGVHVLLHAQRRELRRQRDADDARRRRRAASSASASLMNGCQLRMPTATGTPGRAARAARRPAPASGRSAASARRSPRSCAASPRRARATAAARRGPAADTPASRRATTACRGPSGERRTFMGPEVRGLRGLEARRARGYVAVLHELTSYRAREPRTFGP